MPLVLFPIKHQSDFIRKFNVQAKLSKELSSEGSELVDLLRQHRDRVPFASPDAPIDNRIRCIQYRLGCMSRGSVYRRCGVHIGSNISYQLPGTASSFLRATSSLVMMPILRGLLAVYTCLPG